jgi:hypothetical protein
LLLGLMQLLRKAAGEVALSGAPFREDRNRLRDRVERQSQVACEL